jgi:phage I-like protein
VSSILTLVQGLNARALVTLGRKAAQDFLTLSVLVPLDEAGKPKTEVRLFKSGWNSTEIGEFLFDAEAAVATMAAYTKHGVPVTIDLEHLSLDPDAPNFDPRARGRGVLELRDGDLWLCSIKWTVDGAARIESGEEIYLSPAFPPPGPDRRITKIHNVALVAQPATDFAVPLAASANHRGNEMDPKLLAEKVKLFCQMVDQGKSHAEIVTLAATDMKTLQAVVKALGGDPTADLGTLFGIVQDFAKSLTEMASGKKVEADKPEDGAPSDGAPAMMSAAGKELETLRSEATKLGRQVETLTRERNEREAVAYHERAAQIVKLGGLTPPRAWADDSATKPSKLVLSQSLAELDAWIKELSASAKVTLGSQLHPPTGHGIATGGDGICEMSEYEAKRLRVLCDRNGTKFERAEALYLEHKGQQVLGARSHDVAQRLARKVEQHMALAGANGRFGRAEYITLSNPITPIQDFSGASQRALEEFRVEFLGALASMPEVWAETFGQMLPGGSLRDTYPLDFEAVVYAERTAQNAVASTPESAEITVDKHEYRASKQAQLRRIQQGDFAYVKTWQSAAATMAIARVHLRNMLVADLLEHGDSAVWGVSTKFPSGIDGANFFSAAHKVNPFGGQTFLGSSTWLNLQAAATALNATHLTEEKAASLLVPAPNGQFIGGRATHALLPLCLDETMRLLLSVQDIILDSSGVAGISNEHKGSGFGSVMGPELAGSGATADYYLLSQERISRGMVPWVVAEDAAEEVLTWDESSDFYKDTGLVKVESKIYCNAALVYPHGIRKIKGA